MNPAAPTDWEEIRRGIELIRARISQGSAPAGEEERRILHTRAEALAREPASATRDADFLEVVEFDLARERYAFPLAQVREVCVLRELTPVPCTPDFVLGIINVRGELRTVIDLKTFFDLPAAGITELNKIVLLRGARFELGVLADAIRGVRRIPLAALQPGLPTLTAVRADYLLGVTSDRLVVLDAGKILSDHRILVEEDVST